MSGVARIQEAIAADAVRSREVERIGPFVATFTRGNANRYLNYAVPEAEAAPSAADVAGLVEAYRSRGLAPRLEYVAALAPAVEPALRAAGFAVERRLPLLRAGARPEPDQPEGFEVLVAAAPADVRAAVGVQWEAYEEPGEPEPSWVSGVAASLERGGLLVLAREAVTGAAAGAGQCTVPSGGATELTSVGVRPPFRRRGVARAVAAFLTREALDRGSDLVFLMAHAASEAERIYERIGYVRVGEVLHISAALAAPTNGDSHR